MKKLLLIFSVLLLSVSLQAQIIRANPFHKAIVVTGGGGGGGTIHSGDTTAASANLIGYNGYIYYLEIPNVKAGSAIKAKVYIGANIAVNARVALYTSDGEDPVALIAGSTSNVITLTVNSYNEFTFGTPIDVTASTVYFLALEHQSGGSHLSFMRTASAYTYHYGFESHTYGDPFPATPTYSFDGSTDHGCYITVTY